MVGDGVCAVKTLTRNHLYCEPPPQQPAPVANGKKREGSDSFPEFIVSVLAVISMPRHQILLEFNQQSVAVCVISRFKWGT